MYFVDKATALGISKHMFRRRTPPIFSRVLPLLTDIAYHSSIMSTRAVTKIAVVELKTRGELGGVMRSTETSGVISDIFMLVQLGRLPRSLQRSALCIGKQRGVSSFSLFFFWTHRITGRTFRPFFDCKASFFATLILIMVGRLDTQIYKTIITRNIPTEHTLQRIFCHSVNRQPPCALRQTFLTADYNHKAQQTTIVSRHTR